ncbi:site-specific DNA-methyltransferase [Thiomicrospira microaerophila]|uniref:site-specific DNA-methyltransferase n=1 Tax=Thiomicrospira microaerophila TaxID=406020 RepID=UPI001E5F49FB|nr:site-specific DNA-methyltransferase [Thiomicrospira microaerophila]
MTQHNIEQLKQLFPNVFTEGKIGFDALKAELGEQIETDSERYQFTWAGKEQAKRIATTPSLGTLRPAPDESVNWDTTENLYIEGDNLEVLKLLQKSYFGQVKMIYIDPPYNTGKDFVYKDDFKDNLANYQRLTGQKDEEGNPLFTNSDSAGRYHSNWLNMMYPRLKLARNLLRDDGVIFISIDDNEVHNLRKICDEIFGERNFVASFIWNTEGNTDNQYEVKVNHEYIVCYIKDKREISDGIGYVIDPNTEEGSNLWKGYADNNINKNSPANPPALIELPKGFPSSVENLFYPKKILDDKFFSETRKDKFISEKVKLEYSLEPKSGLPVKVDDMIIEKGLLKQACRIYVGTANKNKLLGACRTNQTIIC